MSIGRKISVGFGGLILLMSVSMGITLLKLDNIKRTAASAIEERQPAANYFQRLSQNLNQTIALINGYMLTGEPESKAEFYLIADDIADRLEGARYHKIFQNLGLDDTFSQSQALLQQFRQHARELFTLRDNNRTNLGLILAEETLNLPALTFLNQINILLSSDDITSTDPQIMKAIPILYEIRYNWIRIMWSLSLYLTTQSEDMLLNFNSFNEHISNLMKKLNRLDVDIGFGEIETMNEARATYIAKLPAVLELFQTKAWRADTHLLQTKVQPITDQLQNLFESTADNLLESAFDNGEELTAALYQIRISAITIMVLALFSGILLAFSISRGILPPIRRLMQAAGEVAKGDLNAEVMITSKDEIGQLGTSFNAMTDNLRVAFLNEQEILDELQTLNQDLESRVENRTKDLEESEIKIRAILDNIGEGILVINEAGIIESLNPAAMTIFAMKDDVAIGLHSSTLTTVANDDDFTESKQTESKQTESKQDDHSTSETIKTDIQPKEYLGLRPDGSTFPMEIVVSGMLIGSQRMRVCIVRDITTRKETENTLADVQSQLVDTAHKSGMADMATGVLHNIGNILNSVNLAGEEIYRISGKSKISGLIKANELLKNNQDNIDEFLTQDSRGKKLPEYFIKMGKVLNNEIKSIRKESRELIAKTTMMKEVISTQQTYAKSGFHSERLNLPELVTDALKIQESSLKKWGVKLDTYFDNTPSCTGQKSKLLQVITNLIKNAKEAMDDNDQFNRPKELHIQTGILNNSSVYLTIKDNGCGISEEQLTKIFNHGFTTKETGHGFGLHTCANAMTEMRGTLKVDSDGPQKGACFTVTIPVSKAA
ncbi:MAG: HAMP domain-containing protein [Ectothiorhodospiraceae bacterium]|nr:HAMP domain-containing protein [Ectothiorhodospiraceae bacterium]